MKYTYDGIAKKDIIKNYEKIDGKIVVTYLDNSEYRLEDTIENESLVLEKMLKQAIERNDADSLLDVEHRMFRALITALLTGGVATISILDKSSSYKIVFTIALTLFLNELKNIGEYIDEFKEIEKYKIYLSIMKELEEYKLDENLFNDITGAGININTIDDYSLSDIKRLNNNLEKCKVFRKI